MSLILAFLTKQDFIKNTPGQVNDFFELSPLSLSYSKTRGEYQHETHRGSVLHTFLSNYPETGMPYELLSSEVKTIMDVAQTVHTYCSEVIGSVNTPNLTAFVQAQHFELIQSFTVGAVHEGDHLKLPEWISWKKNDSDGSDVRVWLRNTAFENQYANFNIVVSPPISQVNLLFGNYASVASALRATTMPDLIDSAQVKADGYPPTYTRFITLKYYNITNPTQYTETQWGFLIYGKNGDNIDSLKDALVNYLLENSSHSQEDWQKILPEVFKRTEFLIFPRWDKVSIQNSNPLASLYASIYNVDDMLSYVLRNNPIEANAAYVQNKLNVLPIDYKAITLAAIPGETNDGDKDSLIEIFPDYIPIGTSDIDFNRMTVRTRNWVIHLVNMVVVAETITEYSSIVNPFRRVKRDGQLFVSFLYENINYLVSARQNNLV